MSDKKSLSKYRVYFFLYLAVVCELLIIIVERDDAEAAWLKEKAELQELTRRVIDEVLNLVPTAVANGNNQMKVGETREFGFSVKGLGKTDEITKQPYIVILREGITFDTLHEADGSIGKVFSSDSSVRSYSFRWTARESGNYEFQGSVGTNRIEIQGAIVKIGRLELPKNVVERYTGKDISKILNQSENVTATLNVKVIPSSDPLKIGAMDIVTAVGFPTTIPIEVEGTTQNRVVSIYPSQGRSLRSSAGRWTWEGTLFEEGKQIVHLRAHDNRGAEISGVAHTSFTVTAKLPSLVRRFPNGAFAGEAFEMIIRVNGLETIGNYSWALRLDDDIVSQGHGEVVKWDVPAGAAGKRLTLTAKYDGKTYPVLKDSGSAKTIQSDFSFLVEMSPYHIISETIRKDAQLVTGSEIQILVTRCGSCVMENRRDVQRNEIRLTVEDENGNDMLDGDYTLEPVIHNGKAIATRVVFRLKRIMKGRERDALVTLRTPTGSKNIPIVIVSE